MSDVAFVLGAQGIVNEAGRAVLEKLGFELRARTQVARPPKFPEPLEASHFSLGRDAFYEAG